ncbi:alpha/beta-hydrolase, partial [Zopfia rhizophila CBS 207.26]
EKKFINALLYFKAKVSNLDIYFVYERGSGKYRQLLLLLHGWPHSFCSYTHLVEKLAHLERFDAFTVVVPSLPRHGFSERPTKPIYLREVARIMNWLMTSVLRYETHIAHGGHWGS